jgi:hypothetical protein
MKRTLVALALFLTSLVNAAEHKVGQFGMGWYSPSAPIGGRVWVSPMVGIDLGIGFADKNALGSANDRFHVNIGIPVDLVQTASVNFFVRPGVELQTNSRTVAGELKSTAIITADFGAEWFVSDQFSLSAGHGLEFSQVSGPEDKWGITGLRALGFESVGFHFYFK